MAIDLAPTTKALAGLIASTPDHQLDSPTPCAEMDVRQLIEHIGYFAVGFTGVARKAPVPPEPLTDWRTEVPALLDGLASAWADPAAWTGTTSAAGAEIPGEVGGLIALDETVVHAWDLAMATGRPYDVDDAVAGALLPLVGELSARPLRPNIFGPPVAVPAHARAFHRLLGLTGRDPGWSAT